jgi:hypothetical protein
MTNLPNHPYLIHPRTGEPLRAIYRTKSGRLVWPQLGGDGTDDPPADNPPADPPAGDPPARGPEDDKPLGGSGEKALKAEREARRAAEKELAKYKKAEQDKADADKTEAERRAAAEARAEAAELRALRLEVAAEKGLNPAQAKRLVGATREELEADADEILAAFPVTKPKKSPEPDPSQGPRGGQPTDLDALIREAQAKGDWRTVISLQNEKLAKTK